MNSTSIWRTGWTESVRGKTILVSRNRTPVEGLATRDSLHTPPVTTVDADRTLQVLRALQEMTANALRHSHSFTLSVECCAGQDPAQSCPSSWPMSESVSTWIPSGQGGGLNSLRRAKRLSGTLTVRFTNPGTRVELTFPIRNRRRDLQIDAVVRAEGVEGVIAKRTGRLEPKAHIQCVRCFE